MAGVEGVMSGQLLYEWEQVSAYICSIKAVPIYLSLSVSLSLSLSLLCIYLPTYLHTYLSTFLSIHI